MAGKADTSSDYGEQFDQFLTELTEFYSYVFICVMIFEIVR